jgi:hypothetical protein
MLWRNTCLCQVIDNAAVLWALTSYFNPMRYRRRRENYRRFRERLGVPLLTVELGYGAFELERGDADALVQIPGHDVLWQKEKLLNAGLPSLPRECDAVACIDCDLLFANEDWAARARTALETWPIAQAFARVHQLAAEWAPPVPPAAAIQLSQPGAASVICAAPESVEQVLGGVMVRTSGRPTVGFAWVFRRSLLERHGFYDGSIIGGGDTAMTCAAYGHCDTAIGLHFMNPHQSRYYRAWGEPFFESVRGRVGALEGEVYHQWHGRPELRRFSDRHAGLAGFNFDPMRDLATDERGAWRWASDKPALHAYVANYFASRKEDG